MSPADKVRDTVSTGVATGSQFWCEQARQSCPVAHSGRAIRRV
jgi:hypothetical protein